MSSSDFPAAWLIVIKRSHPAVTKSLVLGSNRVYTSRRRAEAAARMIYGNLNDLDFVKVAPVADEEVPF